MTNEVQKVLQTPAIALIASGTLNVAIAFLTLVGGLLRLILGIEDLPAEESQRLGFIAGTVLGYGLALITLVASPLIIYGGTQMLAGKKYRISKASAFCSVFPLTSCCFLIGIPVGVWALVILHRPEVKAFFASRSAIITKPSASLGFGD